LETVLVQQKPKSNRKKLILWLASVLFLLIIVSIIAVNLFLSRSLPQIEGEITIATIQQPVQIIRDEKGVPHIFAKNEHDLYVAQGYAQAQDRLFQMDLSRRQASGMLSEVIGDATLNNDKYFRTLGLRRAAEASYEQYSEEAKEVLHSFAEGVNTYIKELEQSGRWPVEFTILGYKPEEWSVIDTLTIGKYMAYDLGGNWEDQAFRSYLLQTFPEEKAYDLFPTYPTNAPYIIGKEELDIESSFATAVIPHEYNGSNNWVISGEKTKSGKPLLSDDPHLGLATPSVWYQMHLKAPTVNVSGVIFAGIPGIILGHNENIAWGVTNTGPDVQDLYIEKRNPENDSQFLYKEEWEQAIIINEQIKVKNEESIDYTITVTRHGPVISEFAQEAGADTVLSLKWTALEPSSELEAVLNMNKARNWDEFETALERFHTPAQNFVFADTDGTIAYKANGKIPIRKNGDSLLPVPGWNDEYEWDGYIPFDELPYIVNPEEGFISTANNKVISEEYPYHISNQWAQPYRQMRIQEVLRTKEGLTIKDMKALQMDQKNLQAEEFTSQFVKVLSDLDNEELKSALNILKSWDYVDEAEGAAPLIFNLWMMKIPQVLFEEQIPTETYSLFRGRKPVVDELLRSALKGESGPWIQEYGGINILLRDSLQLALNDIEKMQGENMDKWQWGKYHQVIFKHPLSSVGPLSYLFNSKGSLSVGGSGVTVQAAAFTDGGTVNHGGSWRFVADLSDLTKSYHLVGPGQSGHVKSDWYNDQVEDWVNGTYHVTNIEQVEGQELLLKPLSK